MNNNTPAKKPEDKLKEETLKSFSNNQKEEDFSESQNVNEIFNIWNMNNKIIDLFANNIEKDQRLKGKYAVILIRILSIQLIVLSIIFILRGANLLNYADSTFNIFITGGIAEIFVLVKVIVDSLFKDNLTEALKIIIENNNKPKYKIKKDRNKSDKR